MTTGRVILANLMIFSGLAQAVCDFPCKDASCADVADAGERQNVLAAYNACKDADAKTAASGAATSGAASGPTTSETLADGASQTGDQCRLGQFNCFLGCGETDPSCRLACVAAHPCH